MYAESRAPAASTSSTAPAEAWSPDETNTTAPTYAAPKVAHASECQAADPARAAAIGPYQPSQAARRAAARRVPMPMTRTSLPGDALVAVVNRWRARRPDGAPRSCADRSTAGRHVE